MTDTYIDTRWTPLGEYEAQADEDGEPFGPLPWVWMIATLEIDELVKVQPNMLMIQTLAQAILDIREKALDAGQQ